MPTTPEQAAALIAVNADLELPRSTVARVAAALVAAGSRSGALRRIEGLRLDRNELRRLRRALAEAPRRAAQQRALAGELGAKILTRGSFGYPSELEVLAEPPPVLYCLGELPDRPAIAIVGSRAADSYGIAAAELFAGFLAGAGLTVVSGLARGVDTAAHRAAIAAEGGATVAILGCGLDHEYPRGSSGLRREIALRGAVLSELPFGAEPRSWNFPIRNRIIAALGAACLVVQAASRSGSLITARLALELGRDVYTVPGRIFDQRSQGANALIRDGAHPVQHPLELLETLPLAVQKRLHPRPSAPRAATDGLGRRVVAALSLADPTSPDELAVRLSVAIDRILVTLVQLEIDGLIRRTPGPGYVRSPNTLPSPTGGARRLL